MQEPPFVLTLLAVSIIVTVGIAWRAFRLGERRARRAAQELTTLNEIGRQLLRAQLNVDDLCELLYEQVGQIISTSLFQVGLFDGEAYHVKVWVRDGDRLAPQSFPDGGRQGIVGWVRQSGQPLLVHDFDAERDRLPAFPEFELENPPRSGLFVPLIAGTSTIGILAIQSYEPHRFDDEHLRLLTALANQAAWSIRNAQLYEHARYRADQLKLIGTVTAQVSRVQPLPDLFQQIVTLVSETFGYYCVSIFLLEGEKLKPGASTSPLFRTPQIEFGQGMIGWAARQGQPALANNVAKDPRYQHLGILPETRSEISLPLKVEDRVLGVLDVQSDQTEAFKSEDVSMLETLAAQIAIAIEQAQTYDAEHRLAQRLEALVQASQTIVSVLDVEDLLDRLVELIAETFDFERVHIFIRVGSTLVFRAGTGPHSVRWLIEELSYALDDPGLIPKVARTGQPERVGDVSRAADYRPGPGVEDTRSEMAVPIQMAGHILGVIDVQSEESDAFTQEHLVLMQSLADLVAVALRNAVLYASERRRRNLADTLREISATLASELDLDQVLAEILKGLRRIVTLNTAAVLLFEESGDAFTIYSTSGPDLEGYVGRRFPLGNVDVRDVVQVEEAVRRVYHDTLGLPDDQRLLSVPLVVGGDVIGFLVGDQPTSILAGGVDFEIVSAFANQASIAISNARLYAAQQAEAYVTTALLQVAEAANAQTDLDEALETIARLTALLSGVSRCLILRWSSDECAYYLAAQYGISRERFSAATSEPLPAESHPLLDLLSVADRPLGAGVGYQLPVPPLLSALLPASAILCFPLRAKRGLVGLLVVDDPRHSIHPRLLGILTGVAHQAAVVLEAASLQASAVERERLEQELEVARGIQASFMPDRPPQLPGWQLSAAWQAARQISGDFYDFIPLPQGLWGLVIADVADKGMPAALFMAVSRTLLRAAAISRQSPAATLVRVNELLFNDARTDLFVTVFYAVWNPQTGEVTYASGGHDDALLVRRAGQVVRLHTRGIALGVIPTIQLEEQQIVLEPGDVLVTYTDGVTEAMQADYTQWGIERFVEVLRSMSGLSAQEMVDGVLQAIRDFVGGAPQSDDLTIWMLKREEL